ncbi:MAG TPA: NADH:flavin oxidoreductase [Vicinamibacteria bacterium]|nr:NADH:flavin oxidoreductase [Vicinamibacteria bacterium]
MTAVPPADPRWPRVASLRTPDAFRAHLDASGIPLDFDPGLRSGTSSPLGQPIDVDGVRVGNRFCILPMEGWDGTGEGEPSPLTERRWRHFGTSGAKLIWGGEAVAVRPEGRANPNQLMITPATQKSLAGLREHLVGAHRERFGANADGDLYVGLQLTHSGRFARPNRKDHPEPLVAYAHPILDGRFPAGVRQLGDEELDRLAEDFVRAARLAYDVGFAFVDVKHCHGYLGHELLSARSRPGRYGGSLDNRTRFMREVIDGIRATVPGLGVVVRLSVFDTVPFRKDEKGHGVPAVGADGYDCAFGLLRDDEKGPAFDETREVLRMLEGKGVRWICSTAGSPYYNPHVQRPALFPPADGYQPPEDPLRGVARQIEATARLKAEFPRLVFVGSGYSYLQEWLPHVGQHAVASGRTDFVGLGRVVLSYPDLPADVLAGTALRRKSICRTFSDCTTGPRLGLVSGCYPLDPFYTAHPDAERLREAKAATA